jgi:hypothetical protein
MQKRVLGPLFPRRLRSGKFREFSAPPPASLRRTPFPMVPFSARGDLLQG